MKNCKIRTSPLMTPSSSDAAWKMTLYRAETSLPDLSNLSRKKENKMSAILIPLQNVLPKSNSSKMITSDFALVQK